MRRRRQYHRKISVFLKILVPVILWILLFSFFSSCSAGRNRKKATDTFPAMDTYMTFTIYGENAREALEGAREEITALEGLWSVTEEESEIYAVNHSGGKAVEVSPVTADLLSFALRMSQRTKGALDPTIYPVLAAWGFPSKEYRVPPEREIKELLQKVDFQKVSLEGNRVSLPEGMMLDLGAVGKGYAGDVLSESLRAKGIKSALLDIGGNIQAIGRKPDGSLWKLGIRSPLSGDVFGSVEAADAAVVTSGAYERYFTGEDGKRYGHILDPETGYPVDNGLLSVTVTAPEGKLCDALSTALFVMGEKRAVEYWQEHRDFEMVLIGEDKTVLVTEGLENHFSLEPGYTDWELEVAKPGK